MQCELKEKLVTYHPETSTPLKKFCKNCPEQIFWPDCDASFPCPYQLWKESGGGPDPDDEPDDDFPPEGI